MNKKHSFVNQFYFNFTTRVKKTLPKKCLPYDRAIVTVPANEKSFFESITFECSSEHVQELNSSLVLSSMIINKKDVKFERVRVHRNENDSMIASNPSYLLLALTDKKAESIFQELEDTSHDFRGLGVEVGEYGCYYMVVKFKKTEAELLDPIIKMIENQVQEIHPKEVNAKRKEISCFVKIVVLNSKF